DTEFVRTPKYGSASGSSAWKKRAPTFKKLKLGLVPWIEIIFGVYMAVCCGLALYLHSASGTVPFLIIFSFGYLYTGVLTLHNRWVSSRALKVEVVPEAKANAEALAA